ncbi:MAG: hypothetical protein VX670_11245, partial [Candidatus Latescibacterota bacterium]|nr:hypothetical protein [Candidatus Latescibacterota bacterium]
MLNRRVVLHAIDATPARWRGDAGSSPLDGASTAASSPRNDSPDTLVDFHTGERVLENDDLRVQLCVSWRHNPELVYDIEEDAIIQSWTDAPEQ